jgi:hypothetical protein
LRAVSETQAAALKKRLAVVSRVLLLVLPARQEFSVRLERLL